MKELELNDKNINEVLKILDNDIKARDKYVDVSGEEALIIVPDTYNELRIFIKDWLPLCSEDAEKRVEKFKKALKRRSFFKGYGLNDNMICHMVARFVATIKIEQCKQYDKLMVNVHKHAKHEYMGYTYLSEIVLIMERFLDYTDEIENDRGTTVNVYDDLRMKY